MTANAEILFDSLAEHAPNNLEAIGVIARSLVELSTASAADAKRIAATISASIGELMEGAAEDEQEDDGVAGARILAKLQEIGRREEELSGDQLLFMAAKASRVEMTAHILFLDTKLTTGQTRPGRPPPGGSLGLGGGACAQAANGGVSTPLQQNPTKGLIRRGFHAGVTALRRRFALY